MAVCNLFKKLTKDTGNFLMFSQYADDLTKFLVRHNDAKAIPSRYILLNVDYSKLLDVSAVQSQGWDDVEPGETPDLNTILPNYLQNYYENTCAFFRDYKSQEENVSNFDYTPVVSRNAFWNAFSQILTFEPWSSAATGVTGPMSSINTSDNLKYIPEFVYRGDINLQSYTEEDNMGYNEIYCYVPNDARRHEYCVKQQDPGDYVEYDREYIEGYNSDDEGFTGLLDIKIPSNTQYSYGESVSFLDEHDEYLEDVALEDGSFDFNTVIVLYDIYYKVDNDNEVRYRDIPLGLYITGTINEDGTVSNSVTKYVSNSDIYGAGTSYGLRIATRFSATPNATYIKEIVVDGGSDYTEFTKVMSSFSETQAKMNAVLSTVDQNENNIKNQLSSFKNYRTNIPYIVEVNGTKYWFVNGKNTNATVMGEIGPMGPTGPVGPAGQSIPGEQGVTGPQGIQGIQGVTGPTGPVGDSGHIYNSNDDSLAEGVDINYGTLNVASGIRSHAEGLATTAIGDYSHTEGNSTITYGDSSHAEGYGDIIVTNSKIDVMSSNGRQLQITQDTSSNFKVGNLIRYNGRIAIVTGVDVNTSDELIVDRGLTVSDPDEYIEKIYGVSVGNHSHTEGCGTVGYKDYTHAGGYYTVADNEAMTAIGRYNATGVTGAIFVVGNGSSVARKNVFSVVDEQGTSGNSVVVTVDGIVNASGGLYQTSDLKKKNIVGEIDLDKAYNLIDKCQTILYKLKTDDKVQVGLIAQEVRKYFPEIVSKDMQGNLVLDYTKLTVIILRVMKDIIKRIQNLESLNCSSTD